jgi:MerR family transcriptional regulator, heat shock protein HspR
MSVDNRPLYTIATAAELLGVHPRTLRLYESAGLLQPARRNNRRIYSNNDLHWVRCVRYLIHEKGLNQEGIRRLLAILPCWEIRGCPEEVWPSCQARQDITSPCWSIAARTCREDGKCSECEVYLEARNRVCAQSEQEEARRFGPDLPRDTVV